MVVVIVCVVIEKVGIGVRFIVVIGIINQCEIVLVWDRKIGRFIYNVIVWQDCCIVDLCEVLKVDGYEDMICVCIGLLLDFYFLGMKLKWLLDYVDGVCVWVKVGELVFGIVDSWLIWNLIGGKIYVMDVINVVWMLFYNIVENCWDEGICVLLGIFMVMLLDVCDCVDDFGIICVDLFGCEILILGVVGDQQVVIVGQVCFQFGMMKLIYGMGCFVLLNIGDQIVFLQNWLLMIIVYWLDGWMIYVFEGLIFIVGVVV